ncbi:YhgE/Pip domain-containing protein [Roseburia sp. MSJ-14]|uniref:YhgE/Pip domain-containing protein n=1 Tax=Roseburia sp. MSJ-14 TaxID=2841514 RepID=UPI001C102B1C|nr:YhgE/Pip domain-containing protein [Roseburia sp. MSJ-14]MBU5472229.1 YhgE/Pip domain-containing protein [Roseburia sp. MSJ-14]
MKNILTIFKSDVKGLVKNLLALIIIIGLCFLPSLYAWFNIYSNWDPYANTGNIKIAAFSEDKGYTLSDGTKENMGSEVLKELKGNKSIGWTMVDTAEEAIEGVKSGDYYAAVVIEKDFTYKMYNMFAEGFENPGITYYENQKKNAVATKITDTAVSTLQQSIDSKFIEVVIHTVFEQTNEMSGQLENSNKMTEFIQKIEGINENLKAYEATIGSILDGNQALTESVGEAQSKLDGLQDKVTKGMSEVQKVNGNIASTKTSLKDFSANVNASLTTIEASLNKISTDITNAQLADKTGAVVSDMTQTAQDTLVLQKQIAELVATLNNITLPDDSQESQELKNQLQEALDALEAISNGAGDIQNILQQLGINGDQITIPDINVGNLPDAGSDIMKNLVGTKVGDITATLNSCGSSVANMRNMYTNSLVPQVDGILDSTTQILGTVSQLLESTNETLKSTSDIFDGVVTTIDGTNQSLEQIQTILQTVSGKLTAITEKLNSVSEDERVEALIELMQGDPDTYGEFFSGPVKIDTKEVYPIANYGSAMTPFYTVLALWVGALLLTALVKVKAEPKDMPNVKLHQLFFGRYLLFFVLGQIQAAIVVFGDIYILHCQILDKGVFWLTASVTSFVFTLLVYALTLSFGDIGKAIAVVIMVIQIAGSGGTFPIELLPAVYRNIYIFFPFPYAINAMRETIGGMYGNTYVKSMGELLIFAVASLAIGLIIRKPFIKLNHFVEERMEDTKMM